MDKVIVTVLLIIGGIVATFAIVNGVYPALARSSAAINSATDQVDDQIKSQIEIINVSDDGSTVHMWVKNTGTSRIGNVENSDVFLSYQGNISRIPYSADVAPLPHWNYQLKGSSSTVWGPSDTNEITISLATPLTSGIYQVKVVIPNGISDEVTFGE
jgi:archaellum component FlaG (FlaF/FlaG flagellin family)